MKKLFLSLSIIAFTSCSTTPVMAGVCMRYENFVSVAKELWGQSLRLRALTQSETQKPLIVEYFVNDEGEYTRITIQPNGLTCVVSNGTAFTILENKGI